LGLGLAGAAIATTLAQWASTWALVRAAKQKLVRDHDLGLTSNKHKRAITEQDRKAGRVVTGRAFLSFAAPVLTLILGKLAAFGFMTHSAAGLPGQPTTLASHQIILSTFFFISPFLEVISQTAQTFLPPYLAPVNDYVAKMRSKDPNYEVEEDSDAQKWYHTAFVAASQLMGIGFMVASVIATLVSSLPRFFPNTITSDVVVQEAVKPLAKYLWVGAFLTAPVAVSEGVLLAKRELPFLATVYTVSTIVLPFGLIEIKKAGAPVGQVWAAFALFQLFRALCFASRIWGEPLFTKLKVFVRHRRSKVASQAS
jgi:Na+-driven multidrug efflux pump